MEYLFRSICMLKFYFPLHIHKIFAEHYPGVCSNDTFGNITCCQNYFNNGSFCIACPLGTFGTNCSNTCPYGFYGLFCRAKCKCYPCDNVSGCQLMTTSDYFPTKDIRLPTGVDWRTVVLSTTGSFLVCFTIGITIYLKLRINTSQGSYFLQDKGGYFNRTDENRHQNGNNNNATHAILQENRFNSVKHTSVESENWNARQNDLLNNRLVGIHNHKQAYLTKKEIKEQKEYSRSVMDHDHEAYDILSLKCNSSSVVRGNSFREPLYKEAAHLIHCSAKSEHIRRNTFLHPEPMLKEEEEKIPLHKILEEESLLSKAETMDSSQGNSSLTENRKKQRRRYRESKKREREEYMYGFTMMLENFKPKQETDGIPESKRHSKDQRKNDKKLLRYSFARPLEMN